MHHAHAALAATRQERSPPSSAATKRIAQAFNGGSGSVDDAGGLMVPQLVPSLANVRTGAVG